MADPVSGKHLSLFLADLGVRREDVSRITVDAPGLLTIEGYRRDDDGSFYLEDGDVARFTVVARIAW